MIDNEPDPGYPRTPEAAEDFLNTLTYDDTAGLPPLPPTTDRIEQGMVTTSFKWTPDMRDRVRRKAAEHGVTPSILIRQYIEMGLLAEQSERMIPLADAVRALTSLPHSA
ncbi:hypothetical protein [Nocardia speluncae]|uniref:hypothetical protein n=1 Tax=Nocardia speluncae TaxID=419477 RepID=UPI00082BC6EE|nr:hypothetical protein [Nocardia speluncae]